MLFSPLLQPAKELTHQSSIEINENVKQLDVDQFGNIYLVINEELKKLDPKGKFLCSYSDPVQGDISLVDLLNPMNPLIYYQNSNLLRVLDNRLNQGREYNLSFRFQDPKSIAAAANNSIWLYDQNADQMILFQLDQNQILNRSPILSQILETEEVEVLDFQASFDQVIVHLQVGESQSLLIFDAQGAFEQKIKLLNEVQSWDYHNKEILVLYTNNSLQFINLLNLQAEIQLSPLENTQQLFYYPPALYLKSGHQLHQYRVQAPK